MYTCIFGKEWHNRPKFSRRGGDEEEKQIIKKRGEDFLENYAKVVLYAYPLLKTVGKDYGDHIRNKAILSYDSAWDTERLTEYLAEEILRKERLEWLRGVVQEMIEELTDLEKDLVAIRYFGKKHRLRTLQEKCVGKPWNERTYFRQQQRLAIKLGELLHKKGLTKEVYLRDFATVDIFKKMQSLVEAGKDRNICFEEKRFYSACSSGS